MPREPLTIGTLNDGAEPEYPSTDVPRILPLVQVLGTQEEDRQLATLVPLAYRAWQDGWIGLTLNPRNFASIVERSADLPNGPAIVVRCVYQPNPANGGAPLSFISCKRPAPAHSDNWPAWDRALGQLVDLERAAGFWPIVFLDANEADPTELETATDLSWNAPRDTSVVGILTHWRVTVLAITQMTSTGEHAPVVALVTVPTGV